MSIRILVVDDHVDSADSLRMLLKVWGYQARSAYSGEAALEVAREFLPQVIFLDIGMPGLDGYAVAERVRRIADSRPVVLVALTGFGRDEDRLHTRRAGFDHHLLKPVDPSDLAALLSEIGSGQGPRPTT